MTQALEAAIEAAQEKYDAGDDDDIAIAAALRAALPAERPLWFDEWHGDHCGWSDCEVAWVALRAHLLGKDA